VAAAGNLTIVNTRMNVNIILTALLVTLILILVLDTNQDTSRVPVTLTKIDPETIQSIRITREDREDVHMMKTSDGWLITRPVRARANQFRLNAILSLLQSTVISQIQFEPLKLDAYGLASPDVTLALDNMEIQFGDINTLDKSRYLKHADKIFLVEDYLYPQLRQQPGFFVNTKLFNHKLKSVHFACVDTINQNQEGAEQSNIIEAWERLEAIDVRTQLPTLHELGNVIIETEEGDSITITIYSDADHLILSPMEAGLHFWIPGPYAEGLGIPWPACVEQDA
jgi:hypothetical protein